MKVNEVEPGQIFTTDNTLTYPKLKLHKGFISMGTQYVYLCRGDVSAWPLSETQLRKVMSNWRMSQEEFDKYKEGLTKRYDVLEV
ncbi:hypothetical protein ES705_27154 [subsurface metagenome]